MNIKLTEIRREVGGRAYRRGLLLLVFMFSTFVWVNGQIPSELTVENAARLRRQIESGSLEEKRSALFDIRNLRSAQASLIAVPALSDKDEMVRATAASSVIFLDKTDAARVLRPLLSDRAEFVRREAAYASGKTGSQEAAGALLNASRSEKALEVRTAIVVALGELGEQSAVPFFMQVLDSRPKEDDEFLRRSAARAIGQVAKKMIGGETTALTPESFLPDKFKDIDPNKYPHRGFRVFADAARVLTRVLSSDRESDDTRREAAFALGEIGDPSTVSILTVYSKAADPYMAEIAQEALLKIERRDKIAPSKDK